MNTRCYFDIMDVCVAYDFGSIQMNLSGGGQMIDSGLYDFPEGYNPLGKSAVDLYIYSALMPA